MQRKNKKEKTRHENQLQKKHLSLEKCFGVILSIIIVFSFFGCQSSPKNELLIAQKEFEKAKAEDAGKYAAEPFEKGINALNSARDEIARQEKKFALSRRYVVAKQFLKTAVDEFKNATSDTNQGLVFTGKIVDGSSPVEKMTLRWSDIQFWKDSVCEKIRFTEEGKSKNPETKTDSKGEFILRIHPKFNPELLETNKQYSIFFNDNFRYGMIHIGNAPFFWKFGSENGKTIQIKGVIRENLGTIQIGRGEQKASDTSQKASNSKSIIAGRLVAPIEVPEVIQEEN